MSAVRASEPRAELRLSAPSPPAWQNRVGQRFGEISMMDAQQQAQAQQGSGT